jgi:hypothetical protein
MRHEIGNARLWQAVGGAPGHGASSLKIPCGFEDELGREAGINVTHRYHHVMELAVALRTYGILPRHLLTLLAGQGQEHGANVAKRPEATGWR